MTGTCSMPDTKTAVPIGRTALLGANPRPAKMFLDTGIEQVAGHVSRERCWGWDGASLEYVSDFSVDPLLYEAGDSNLYRYVGNSPTIYTDPSGLFWGEVWGGIKGLGQGVANLGNVVTDTAIAIPNTVPLAWNYTAGWVAPNCPYIPSPDWSKGLVTDEPDWCHSVSKGAGNVALIAGTCALSLEAQAARAAEAEAARRAAAAEFFNNPLRQPSYTPPYNPRMPRFTPRGPNGDYFPPDPRFRPGPPPPPSSN
jgi:hypothetical protein